MSLKRGCLEKNECGTPAKTVVLNTLAAFLFMIDSMPPKNRPLQPAQFKLYLRNKPFKSTSNSAEDPMVIIIQDYPYKILTQSKINRATLLERANTQIFKSEFEKSLFILFNSGVLL